MKKSFPSVLSRGAALAISLALLAGCGLPGGSTQQPASSGSSQVSSLPAGSDSRREPAQAELSGATVIRCSGTAVEITGSGAEYKNGTVTIQKGGTYSLSGSLTGSVLVNAKGEKVTLVLNGIAITCPDGSPLYVYKAEQAVIHVTAGTENTLTDSAAYDMTKEYYSQTDEDPNACLYSKADLVIEGAGSLTVNGLAGNGLTGKDTLELCDAVLTVNAKGHGINGKDSLLLDSANVTVTSGGDAIRSSKGSLTVNSGTVRVSAGDDGLHAETDLTIHGGSITVEKSYEGLEGETVTVNGGVIDITASDDGINAAGSSESGMPGGFGAGGTQGVSLTINGGTVTVRAGGDGLDSNGSLLIAGGMVAVFSTGNADGALDSDGSLNITGGVVFAADTGAMSAAPQNPTQGTAVFTVQSGLAAGEFLCLSVGETEYVVQMQTAARCVVFSAPELKAGETLTVRSGGSTAGTENGAFRVGGSYTGGSELARLTLSDGLTGSAGGMGGFGGNRPGDGGTRPGNGGWWPGNGGGQQPGIGDGPGGEMPGGQQPGNGGQWPGNGGQWPGSGEMPGGRGEGAPGFPGEPNPENPQQQV